MRKGNKIFEALSANFERNNSEIFKGCVRPSEEEALDELFAIPQPVEAFPLSAEFEQFLASSCASPLFSSSRVYL